jgi:hypothetical protein
MGVLTSVVSLYVDDVVESTDGHEEPGAAGTADGPGDEDDAHPSYQELRQALNDYKEARDRIAGNGDTEDPPSSE